jgi:hypothetical protein
MRASAGMAPTLPAPHSALRQVRAEFGPDSVDQSKSKHFTSQQPAEAAGQLNVASWPRSKDSLFANGNENERYLVTSTDLMCAFPTVCYNPGSPSPPLPSPPPLQPTQRHFSLHIRPFPRRHACWQVRPRRRELARARHPVGHQHHQEQVRLLPAAAAACRCPHEGAGRCQCLWRRALVCWRPRRRSGLRRQT